jgi:hypothetical protein
MSAHIGPKIVNDNLVFKYDMANGKSFVGGPATNTLPSPSVNGLPTFGNGWGTYNTNQYNNNTYFSIGVIANVASNIVTTTGNHPLRSYDVVTPQSTGGGLSAGTNYLVKKLSNTTFSLHAYNSSQDGSQGYINPATGNHKVYDDFANDVRIAVNLTSFPTMWWGPPHLPNSALVKEIIPQGFTGIPGRPPTDCIRQHYNRTDATDGMAYNVDAAVVAGTPYTVSFWARSVTANAVGTTGSYQIYNYGATTPSGYSVGYTLGPVGVWQKYILTFTPNNPLAISYWFPGAGGIKYDIANIQFEVGSVANNFVAGTRSNTQAIVDIAGNNTVTAVSLTYASNNTFSFDRTGNNTLLTSLPITFTPALSNFTYEVFLNITSLPPASNNGVILGATYYSGAAIYWRTNGSNFNIRGFIRGNDAYRITAEYTLALNTVYHVVMTNNYSAGTLNLYVNGVLFSSVATATQEYNAGNIISAGNIGVNKPQVDGGGAETYSYFTGRVDLAKIYTRALSADDVRHNFNAIKNRYLGESPDIPALSGYALKQARPDLPSGYYWIKNHLMPNALRMYVDMTEEGGGYDFYAIEGGTSFSLYSDTHSGTALGLDYVYPRSKNHWRAMSNFVKNTLGYTGTNYTRFFVNVGKVYRTGGIGNYTSFPMRDPNYYGTGAPDWRVPDGGRWWLRDTAYSEPNGNHTIGGFLYFWQGHMLENYDLRDLLFDDGGAPATGTYYLVSTNAKP